MSSGRRTKLASASASQRNVLERLQAGRKDWTICHQAPHRTTALRELFLRFSFDISDTMYIVSDMKTTDRIQNIDKNIESVKADLLALGDMRPGSITRQYNVCGKANCRCKDPEHPRRHGPYYKLSYAHKGKFTTQFIRKEALAQVRTELANYKKFRQLSARLIDLSLQRAKLKLSLLP